MPNHIDTELLYDVEQILDPTTKARLSEALRAVIANIFDQRAKVSQVRSATVKFSFVPANEERSITHMAVEVDTKIAKPKPVVRTMQTRRKDDGTITMSEVMDQLPGQVDVHGDEQPMGRVISFNAKG